MPNPRAIVPVFYCLLVLGTTLASAQSTLPDIQVALMPYYVDISLEKLEKVDGVEQSFTATFSYSGVYPSRDIPVSGYFKTPGEYNNGMVRMTIAQVEAEAISPVVDFANSNDVTELRRDIWLCNGLPGFVSDFSISPSGVVAPPPNTTGWIMVFGRYSGTFKSTLSLAEFPYDRQSIPISVRLAVPMVAMQFGFKPSSNFTKFMEKMSEWDVLRNWVEPEVVFYSTLPLPFHQISFRLEIERKPQYYINKIVSGIIFIVFMNWWCFALDQQDSNRMAICATLFLSIVAYLFLVTNDVPKVSYTTRLDNFISWSMLNIFLTYSHHAIVYYIDKKASRQAERAEYQQAETAVAAKTSGTFDPPTPSADRVRPFNDDDDDDDNNSSKYAEVPAKPRPSGSTRGWWMRWREVRHKVDFCVLVACIITYCVGSAVFMLSTQSM